MTKHTWEAVIGLEIHAQLLTKSKLFCSSSTNFGLPTNSAVGPVDAGMPGTLPVTNRQAIEMAVRAGLALNCTIHQTSIWSRKHYFYPDLPKGYQISQYDRPLCTDGHVTVVTDDGGEKRIRIHRIHVEEDAGKNIHEGAATWVNLNRAGVPLIEIVSEPDLRNSKEAAAYMKKIWTLVRYVGVCDGNMEEGSLRCDVNVSVRHVGAPVFGTRVELKNINSFKFVERAIDHEIERQIEVLESGGTIIQETRSFDPAKGVTTLMRKKEDAHDYRYFPDPDLPPLKLTGQFIEDVRKGLPEMPDVKRERFMRDYALPRYDADILSGSTALANYFESAAKGLKNAKTASNWIMTAVLRDVDADSGAVEKFPVPAEHLREMLQLMEQEVISGKIAKSVYEDMLKTGKSAKAIVDEKGLVQITDASAIEKEIEAVLAAHPAECKELLAGKDKLVGFFIGQLMRRTQGKANPKIVQDTFSRMVAVKRKGNA